MNIDKEGFSAMVSQVLTIPQSSVDLNAHISEYGFDSMLVHSLTNAIHKQYAVNIVPVKLFTYHSLQEIFSAIVESYGIHETKSEKNVTDIYQRFLDDELDSSGLMQEIIGTSG